MISAQPGRPRARPTASALDDDRRLRGDRGLVLARRCWSIRGAARVTFRTGGGCSFVSSRRATAVLSGRARARLAADATRRLRSPARSREGYDCLGRSTELDLLAGDHPGVWTYRCWASPARPLAGFARRSTSTRSCWRGMRPLSGQPHRRAAGSRCGQPGSRHGTSPPKGNAARGRDRLGRRGSALRLESSWRTRSPTIPDNFTRFIPVPRARRTWAGVRVRARPKSFGVRKDLALVRGRRRARRARPLPLVLGAHGLNVSKLDSKTRLGSGRAIVVLRRRRRRRARRAFRRRAARVARGDRRVARDRDVRRRRARPPRIRRAPTVVVDNAPAVTPRPAKNAVPQSDAQRRARASARRDR